MPSIREVQASLDSMKAVVSEIIKESTPSQYVPVPKISFEFDQLDVPRPRVKKDIVPKEIYSKMVKVVESLFTESDSYFGLTEIAKSIYNKGLRPKILPEEFVQVVVQVIDEVGSNIKLETKPDLEGIKYRRATDEN